MLFRSVPSGQHIDVYVPQDGLSGSAELLGGFVDTEYGPFNVILVRLQDRIVFVWPDGTTRSSRIN